VAELEMSNVTREKVPATLLADAQPFNEHHVKDIWKHLLVSLCIVAWLMNGSSYFRDFASLCLSLKVFNLDYGNETKLNMKPEVIMSV
jgi:hypothetical protein